MSNTTKTRGTENLSDTVTMESGPKTVYQSVADIDQISLIKLEQFVSKLFKSHLEQERMPSVPTIKRRLTKLNNFLSENGLNTVSEHVLQSLLHKIIDKPRLLGGVGDEKGLPTAFVANEKVYPGIDQATLMAFAGLAVKGGTQAAYEGMTQYVTHKDFSSLHLFMCIRYAFEPAQLIAAGKSKAGTTMPYKHTAETIQSFNAVLGETSPARRVGDTIMLNDKLAALLPHLSQSNVASAAKNDVPVTGPRAMGRTQGQMFQARTQEQGKFGTVNRQMTRRIAHLAIYLLDNKTVTTGAIRKNTTSEQMALKGISGPQDGKTEYFSTEKKLTKKIANDYVKDFLGESKFWTEDIKAAIIKALRDDKIRSIIKAKAYSHIGEAVKA